MLVARCWSHAQILRRCYWIWTGRLVPTDREGRNGAERLHTRSIQKLPYQAQHCLAKRANLRTGCTSSAPSISKNSEFVICNMESGITHRGLRALSITTELMIKPAATSTRGART